MSPEQKSVVKATWQRVVPIADTAAELFYDRLFELDPQLRSLFVGVDLASQRKKLVQALTTVVEAINHIEDLVPVIRQLGQRHRSYGVKDNHYEIVGAALIWTLEKGLGDSWNAQTAAAWTEAYTLIADMMRHHPDTHASTPVGERRLSLAS